MFVVFVVVYSGGGGSGGGGGGRSSSSSTKCASRHNCVHFCHISISKSAPNVRCVAHFEFEMCFAPQRRALFHFAFPQTAPHPPL